MASVVVNKTVTLSRGRPTKLGTVAAGQAVQFNVPPPQATPNGNDFMTVISTGLPPLGVAGSLDGGATWFGVSPSSTSSITTASLNGDTAVGDGSSFEISGLQGALFRASGLGDIWAMC